MGLLVQRLSLSGCNFIDPVENTLGTFAALMTSCLIFLDALSPDRRHSQIARLTPGVCLADHLDLIHRAAGPLPC